MNPRWWLLALSVAACAHSGGTPSTRTVTMMSAEPVVIGPGPLSITQASRLGQGRLVCWASGQPTCERVQQQGVPLFDLEADGETWNRTATVPRGMHLCCGFDGGAGELTITTRPGT